ncbi:MAG: NAD(P)/FAD-dependent oxidoreductase [Deltaproteobacteria bacterium]|nr:NAD(P)/FAD-dependent oxidoreductase [Deltaproteobacteria bacterium]
MATSPSRYDTIVIGSGMGGTSAAALLAKAGLRTLLLEKNPRLGGSCSYYEKRGFHIDYGTHMFSRGWKGPLGAVQRRLGIPRERRVRFVRTRDIAVLRGQGFELAVPSEGWRMPAFCLEAVRLMKVPLRELPRVTKLFADIVTMSEAAIAEWDGRTVEELLLEYTDNPRLFGALGLLLGLYFILPFWEVSAGEAIWCFQKMARDNALSYPVGGSYALPRTLCDAAARYGASIETRAGVRRIEPAADGKLRVTTSDGRELTARAVVSTTSRRELADGLCPPGTLPSAWSARASATRGSYIAVQAKIALRRPRERAGCLVGSVARDPGFDPLAITMDDYRVMFADIAAGRVPKVVPIYCPIPTNFDAALGPPGTQLLTACMVAPTTEDGHGTRPIDGWQDSERKWIDAMMAAMAALIPGLEADTLFADTMGVQAIASWIGKRGGPAVSTGQTPEQSGARRPGVRTPLHGLYVAGDGAGARGVGTELACASGMLCADAVLADLGGGASAGARS